MSGVGESTHGIEASQDHDDKQKREERREEREERREKTEDRPTEAARGPQMRPPDVPPEGPTRFFCDASPCWDLWRPHFGTEGRGKRAEKREKREERREKMAASSIHCISTVSRGHLKEVMKIRRGHRNCSKLESLHFYGVP